MNWEEAGEYLKEFAVPIMDPDGTESGFYEISDIELMALVDTYLESKRIEEFIEK